jgi:hypothetical protein
MASFFLCAVFVQITNRVHLATGVGVLSYSSLKFLLCLVLNQTIFLRSSMDRSYHRRGGTIYLSLSLSLSPTHKNSKFTSVA